MKISSKYLEARPKWFELLGAGKTEEAAAWRAQTTPPFGAATVKGLSQLIELQEKNCTKRIEQIVTVTASILQQYLTTLSGLFQQRICLICWLQLFWGEQLQNLNSVITSIHKYVRI